MRSRLYLSFECAVLFALMPVVLWWLNTMPPIELDSGMVIHPRRMIFVILWLFAIACLVWWRRAHKGQKIWRKIPRESIRPMLIRFAGCAVFMTVFIALYDYEKLLGFPSERPQLWLMVMVLYPLVSVIPQELAYRLFFFDRYATVFTSQRAMILASGLAFGHGHLLFNNWVAYLLSIAGGIIFSCTYAKSRSFSLVWAEHAIYGQFVFTIGLGWYFYSGAAMSH